MCFLLFPGKHLKRGVLLSIKQSAVQSANIQTSKHVFFCSMPESSGKLRCVCVFARALLVVVVCMACCVHVIIGVKTTFPSKLVQHIAQY